MPEIRLSTYADARDAFRHRDLRQALYDEGAVLMDDVIVNLHGAAHTDRRRLENRLFRRDTFLRWERDVIPTTVERVLAPCLAVGHGDLIDIARRTMMTLSAEIAGVDLPADDDSAFGVLYDQMSRLARASTVIHFVGDKAAVIADGSAALVEFDERFLQPATARRAELVASVAAGADPEQLPRDVLTTLLQNQDRLALPDDVVRREIAYFPWVGSHSTSNGAVHAANRLFEHASGQPAVLDGLRHDRFRLQRFVHEALRLHPASMEMHRRAMADVTLSSGREIPAGATVIIEMTAANRDRRVFGADADAFDPDRVVPDDVPRWGLTFGTGFHACLGMELAGGLPAGPEASADVHLFGAITMMIEALLRHGARPDPDDPPEPDLASKRPNFGRYPVVFTAAR
jgi:cytochrome P450